MRQLPTNDKDASTNHINRVGDPLENYVKDAFANTLDVQDAQLHSQHYQQTFSWTGSSNNPPDFMLRGGDAVEVKKTGSPRPTIQLNSSYPKRILNTTDPMLSQACRDCEPWIQKDLIYSIGHIANNEIQSMWMTYGDCFVANSQTYTKIAKAIQDGIEKTGINLTPTKELARANKVDPLGITALRVRGMWIIAHPEIVFKQLLPETFHNNTINAIMSENKFYSFPDRDRKLLQDIPDTMIDIHTFQTPSPNNPDILQNLIYIGLSL